MSDKNERFWRSLREATDAANTSSEHELRKAEELLREIDFDEATNAPEALSPKLVEHWVEQAVSSPHAPQLTAVQAADDRPTAKPWRAWLAAAAAFLVTPKFLVAATVTAGIAVTTMLLQHTTTSLPFQEAVQILMDAEQPDAARAAAGGRVYFDVAESVMTLTSLADGPESPGARTLTEGPLADAARTALAQLRQELELPTPFAGSSFSHSLTDLTTTLFAARDGTATLDPDALQEFTEQARFGIQAIREADTDTMPAEVRTNSRLHLIQIRRLLQR